MTKKIYNLVVACVGGASTIAIGIVTYCNPASATAINIAIGIACTAALEICNLFVKE